MGFYAPYKFEQFLFCLIAYRSALRSCKDVIRLIGQKYLLHWFADKADYYFCMEFGGLYNEQERAIQRDTAFIRINDKDIFNFVFSLCAANLKAGKNVTLISDNGSVYHHDLKKYFWNMTLIQCNDEFLHYKETGRLVLLRHVSYHTSRGNGSDLIIITDFNHMNKDYVIKGLLPILVLTNAKLVCFYTSMDEILDNLKKVYPFF